MSKKNLRRVSLLITPQSASNLERLRTLYGCKSLGQTLDIVIREKMLALRAERYGRGREQ